ncbi:flagellar hook-basal body complex protein FliE [Burkholderia sp. BCC1977]|uniref:flagellar hook-basal body complex protein FliE n=1 Tax=Burkholderia sp. BCC1977 TaxID=2817440 RepID=UPI002ABDAE59|nr:flagellar hook-basal body complex protein FliE [Burkholderia sp. BCC1977]
MSIDSVESVQPLPPAFATQASLSPRLVDRPGFADWLSDGVTRVDHAVVAADRAVAGFALDGSTPPHQVMMALEEARMSLQFALQVRARLVEGYQELMRMQL